MECNYIDEQPSLYAVMENKFKHPVLYDFRSLNTSWPNHETRVTGHTSWLCRWKRQHPHFERFLRSSTRPLYMIQYR